MKQVFVFFLVFAFLIVSSMTVLSCADSKVIDGIKYEPYGLFNSHTKSPDICYEIVAGNIVWSILLIETVFIPVYFVGWKLFEPVAVKDSVYNPSGCF